MSTTALMAGGGILGALGSLAEGERQAQNLENEAQSFEYNATLAKQEATYARQRAMEEERRVRYQVAKQKGELVANVGANGIQLEGSALDALRDLSIQGELDALTVRHQGELEYQAYEREAYLGTRAAGTARVSIQSVLNGSYLAAAGSLAGAAGRISAERRTSSIGRPLPGNSSNYSVARSGARLGGKVTS